MSKEIIAMKEIHNGSMSQNQRRISGNKKMYKLILHKYQCHRKGSGIVQCNSGNNIKEVMLLQTQGLQIKP
jgi:hypothetical protein